MKLILCPFFILYYIIECNTQPTPFISTSKIESNLKTIQFNLTLSSNDILNINISFQS